MSGEEDNYGEEHDVDLNAPVTRFQHQALRTTLQQEFVAGTTAMGGRTQGGYAGSLH